MGQSHTGIVSDARIISEEDLSVSGLGNIKFGAGVKKNLIMGIHEDDFWKLKILLQSFFESSRLADITKFEEMSELIYSLEMSTEERAVLILELLYTIRRYDLLKYMGCCKHKLCSYFQNPRLLKKSWVEIYNGIENSSLSDANNIISNFWHHQNSYSPSPSTNSTTHSDRQRGETTPETPIQGNPFFPSENRIELYPLQHSPCGYCFIINNENFHDEDYIRKGSSVDREKLENLFRSFDFDVTVGEDLTSMQMKLVLKMQSQKDYSQYDAFACCILSHGTLGCVLGVESECDKSPLNIYNDVVNLFIKDCKSLVGKPKLFFIQACQGSHSIDYENNTVVMDSILPDDACYIPACGDYVLFMSAFPGTRAYRSVHDGSWFINHLTKELFQHGHECSLLDILTLVNKSIAEEEAKSKDGKVYKQRSLFHSALTKKFIFKKKQQ